MREETMPGFNETGREEVIMPGQIPESALFENRIFKKK
jgi:hypothetical protein